MNRSRIEELQELIRKAEQDAQDIQERTREAREARERRKEAEWQTQNTTLDEYLAACHHFVFSRFKVVEQDKPLTSKGSIASPLNNKRCPTNLRPWKDFLQQQNVIFGQLYATVPTETRLFENRDFLAGLGNRISQRPIANDWTLKYALHHSIEVPIGIIMDKLKGVEGASSLFGLGDGIVFSTQPNAISDDAEEVVDRENVSLPNLGQICVSRLDDGRRTMIYVSEYKATHKLTAPCLRRGLRPMDIHKEVIDRKIIPTSADPDALFQYYAEKVTVSALTQIYHYMIEGGLEYGLLTTGEAIVFLKINWDDVETLYYHLAEPGPEVLAHPNNIPTCTALGQYLAFSLMALGPPGQRRKHGQDERKRVIARLRTWNVDFESVLRSIPVSERSPPDNSSACEPTTYSTCDRSPCPPPKLKRRISKDGPNNSPESSESSPTERRAHGADQGVRRSQRILAQQSRGGHEQGQKQQQPPQPPQYCTQRCLLGLVRGGLLDPKCPNVALHCVAKGGKSSSQAFGRHPVTHDEWLELLGKQLELSLDDGVVELGKQGARGMLLQVTMLSYGYTLVCKGTVRAFIKDLEHEAAVYRRLESIQGTSIPVFLGAIDLRPLNRTYYYHHRVYIVHMTFLSWGGDALHEADIPVTQRKRVEDEVLRCLHAIHGKGVVHQDMRTANMLYSPETGRVLLVDFERAALLDAPRRPLAHSVPNKRRTWDQATLGSQKDTHRKHRTTSSVGFSNDRAMAIGAVRYELSTHLDQSLGGVQP